MSVAQVEVVEVEYSTRKHGRCVVFDSLGLDTMPT
jgi:hypothetical protein